MSDEAPVKTDPEANVVRAAAAIKAEYLERLGNASSNVRGMVVDQFVADEIKARADLLYRAVKKREEMERDLRKIKPDNTAYDASGKIVSESFTKAKADELKKAKEQLDKLDKAIDMAVQEKPDYSKLKEVMGNS